MDSSEVYLIPNKAAPHRVRFCYFVELAEVVNPHAFIATTFFTPNPYPTHSSVSCALLSFNHLNADLRKIPRNKPIFDTGGLLILIINYEPAP